MQLCSKHGLDPFNPDTDRKIDAYVQMGFLKQHKLSKSDAKKAQPTP